MSKKLTALSLAFLLVFAFGLQAMAVGDESIAANNTTTRTDRTNMNDLNPFTNDRTGPGVGNRDMIGNDGTNMNNNGMFNNDNNMGRNGYRGYNNNDGFGTRNTRNDNWNWLGLLGLIGLAGLFGRNRVEGDNR